MSDSAAATKQEQEMGFKAALRAYPRASFFSILFSTAIVSVASFSIDESHFRDQIYIRGQNLTVHSLNRSWKVST